MRFAIEEGVVGGQRRDRAEVQAHEGGGPRGGCQGSGAHRPAGVQDPPAGHPRPGLDLWRHLRLIRAADRPGHRALKNDQAQVANIFSTDPAIATNGFVLLEDDKKLFGSQNVVPLVAKDRASQVSAALDAVSAKLTTAVLTDLLKKTDIDKRPHAEVAKEWLASIGLA